jgi:hypothetical protein
LVYPVTCRKENIYLLHSAQVNFPGNHSRSDLEEDALGASGFGAELESDELELDWLEAELDELSDELSDESLLTFFFEPVLKSVSYQPAPFNLKATADISFFRLA